MVYPVDWEFIPTSLHLEIDFRGFWGTVDDPGYTTRLQGGVAPSKNGANDVDEVASLKIRWKFMMACLSKLQVSS